MAGKIKTTGTMGGKSNALGGGGRFKQVEMQAAASGRAKYGASKMAKMAAAGKKRAARKK